MKRGRISLSPALPATILIKQLLVVGATLLLPELHVSVDNYYGWVSSERYMHRRLGRDRLSPAPTYTPQPLPLPLPIPKTSAPTTTPKGGGTRRPTLKPTPASPSVVQTPTNVPSLAPSKGQSVKPTLPPSMRLSQMPAPAPSFGPPLAPSPKPSAMPTISAQPSAHPTATAGPTPGPSIAESMHPTATMGPTSNMVSSIPTSTPSLTVASDQPSDIPSNMPTSIVNAKPSTIPLPPSLTYRPTPTIASGTSHPSSFVRTGMPSGSPVTNQTEVPLADISITVRDTGNVDPAELANAVQEYLYNGLVQTYPNTISVGISNVTSTITGTNQIEFQMSGSVLFLGQGPSPEALANVEQSLLSDTAALQAAISESTGQSIDVVASSIVTSPQPQESDSNDRNIGAIVGGVVAAGGVLVIVAAYALTPTFVDEEVEEDEGGEGANNEAGSAAASDGGQRPAGHEADDGPGADRPPDAGSTGGRSVPDTGAGTDEEEGERPATS